MEQFKDHTPVIIPANPALRGVINRDVTAALARFSQRVSEHKDEIVAATATLLLEMAVIHVEQHKKILSYSAQVSIEYGPYLVSMIGGIVAYGEKITGHWAAPLDRDRFLQGIRAALTGRVPHWLSEAYAFIDAGCPPDQRETFPVDPAKLKEKRRKLVGDYRRKNLLEMAGLARHVGVSLTAIYGMINSDPTRYTAATLDTFLAKIGVSRKEWNEV